MTRHASQAAVTMAAVIAVTGAAMTAPDAVNATARGRTMSIQLLAINDLHGHLEPPNGPDGLILRSVGAGRAKWIPAGGIAYLATHLDRARRGHPHTLTVGAGDLIGASPLLSSAYHDEPTILAMRRLGLAVSSVGNHEFDEGLPELRRIAEGGCRHDTGCSDPGHPYPGASFGYLAANVVDTRTRRPVFPPTWIADVDGARIGFIGVVLRETPTMVTSSALAGLTFLDEVSTANRYARQLRADGVQAIVALIHQGGTARTQVYDYDCRSRRGQPGLTGPIVDIARRLDPGIDLVLSGHSHQSYVCDIPDPAGRSRLVTSAASSGRLFTDVETTFDLTTRDFVRSSMRARNVVVTRTVRPDPTVAALITRYRARIAPTANRPIGYIARTLLGPGARTMEQPLGDVIADAQLAATASPASGGAELALTNPSGIRANLLHPRPRGGGPGAITYATAFATQPFHRKLVTMDLTGEQLLRVFRQQFTGINAAEPQILQVSAGVTYRIDPHRIGAAKVSAESIRINGRRLRSSRTYRLTVNSYLADGRDGFATFAEGRRRVTGILDIDALVAYLAAHSTQDAPLRPPPPNRIR